MRIGNEYPLDQIFWSALNDTLKPKQIRPVNLEGWGLKNRHFSLETIHFCHGVSWHLPKTIITPRPLLTFLSRTNDRH